MAWVTGIVDDEQVEYRLTGHAGCYVQHDGEGLAELAQPAADGQVDYRMDAAEDGTLVWIGEGLVAVGQTPGTVLDEAGKRAARALANGVHPVTGEQLVRPELRAHPRAKLTGARLVEAIEAAAEAAGCESADLFAGKPKQAKKWATLARMVHQKGERHRLQVDSLHRLARAAGLALEDIYDAEELAEARAHEGERVSVRIRAYDVVADLPKSDSTLWALLAERHEKEFRALVHQAKREAFAELERWIGYGLASEDGTLHRIATGGLLGWSVEHQSARPVDDTPGDPHLHVHIVIVNMARCEDGQWRAIANGGMDLHRHAKAFDALFKARVRALAHERFGVRYARSPRTGAWEVEGIPEPLRDHYSRRAAQVDAIAGADASREEKLRVSAATRHAKHDTGAIDLRATWRRRAEDLGYDVDAMIAAAAPGPPGPGGPLAAAGPDGPRTPSPEQIAAEVFDPEGGLTAFDKEFSKAQLLARVADACPLGLEAAELEALAERVLAVKGYVRALPPRGSQLMAHTERYTTRDILAAERIIVEQARARYADGSARLSPEQAAAAVSVFEVAAGFPLAAEQRRVVQRLLTAGHGVDAVIGVAGSGKTSLMEACRIGWDAVGLTYAGASLSAVAAQNLYEGSGIPSSTVATWLQRIHEGTGLAGIDVLVLDEAAMTDDRSMAALLTEAARTGTKVIAVGDPQQLQAIGPGGGFAEVHRLVGGEILTVNRRQKDAGERAALEIWRTGAREQALHLLADRGRIHATDSADDARRSLLTAWNQARARYGDAYDLLDNLVVLAARNHDADLLNAGAQALRRAVGELGREHRYALPGGDHLALAVGDVVRVRANDYRSRRGAGPDVLNGYRAVVTDIADDHRVQITWRRRTSDGTTRTGQAWLTPDQITAGALSLGYAMTIAASQGLTCDTALVYGLGANAYALYPGITRARTANHLWLPAAALEDPEIRARLGDPRDEAELLERALQAYTALLRQDRPDVMVSDQLRAAPSPAAPPAPAVGEPAFPAWDDHDARPYGALPSARLEARLAKTLHAAAAAEHAADEQTRKAQELAAAAAEQPSAGQRTAQAAAAVLAEADRLAAIAQQATGTARLAAATVAQAESIKERIEAASGRSRIALWLASTSRAEQQALLAHYTRQLADAQEEQRRAEHAAAAARQQAWQTLRTSPYAEALRAQGALGEAPDDPVVMRQQFAAMRAHLPALATQIDTARAEAARQARHEAVALRAQAHELRAAAEQLQTEQQLRRQISAQAPQRHAAEEAARDAALQRERRQNALRARQAQRWHPQQHLRGRSPIGR
ncbi:MobF family relaxase [Streptomyces thermoalcalitolerans]|uniref:TrwC relaxase domain-containing protein n=1 Tax=Streptomyces thermoalcalitolerans TaxID=65605 RepID=A0ABN1P9Q4_9ACTN